MKKNLIFMMSATLLMIAGMGMMACNNDDDVVTPKQETPSKETGTRHIEGTIITIPGDESNYDALYDFFNKELPLMSVSKHSETFLLDHLSDNCYIINSDDELRSIYTGKEQLPAIDFESYTLIIGQKLSNNVYQNLDKQSFYERDGVTYLDLYFSGDIVLPMLAYFNYWGLYPKFSNKGITVNIIINK